MPVQEFHPSDQELLRAMDGELSTRDLERVQSHLAGCWECRTRQQELETTISEFMRIHRGSFDVHIPPIKGPRTLLKARLAQLAETKRTLWPSWFPPVSGSLLWAVFGAVCGLGILAFVASQFQAQRQSQYAPLVTVPNPSLTPGAMVLATQGEVCRDSNANNKPVPAAIRRRVFAEYGIKAAQPSTYEVDYLITPALGGADDIHNLWPQSNREAVWNAQVKDVLEDHLRHLVCDGQLDLASAQRDIATNWIEAYKKYFHTDRPLPQLH